MDEKERENASLKNELNKANVFIENLQMNSKRRPLEQQNVFVEKKTIDPRRSSACWPGPNKENNQTPGFK